MPDQENHVAVIERLARQERGRILAILLKQLRDFELAEDALQEALIVALEKWSIDGVPNNPAGWLLGVARRKMIDQVRRRENFRSKEQAVIVDLESRMDTSTDNIPEGDEDIPDERLRLMFTCCHPALKQEAQVALTLQVIGGLTTSEVAEAYLVPESTMAQRLVRAKRKIRDANIPYEIPRLDQLDDRFDSILQVVYLIFNEGYSAHAGESVVRVDLAAEAIRLARILVKLAPSEPEVIGLLSLMLLHHSRTPARLVSNELVTLEFQDRSIWDQPLIEEGVALVEQALIMQQPGAYQIQAAISALHSEAKAYAETDWKQIYLLYQELYKLQPSPVVRLNSIVALSFAGGPEAALEAIEALREDKELESYQPFHAALADFHRRLGNKQEAKTAYLRAIELSSNGAERRFLAKQIDEL